MLTVRDLIESYGINEAAADLAEISGADCPPQKLYNWLSAGSVPSHWIPIILIWMRRRHKRITVDDLAALCSQKLVRP